VSPAPLWKGSRGEWYLVVQAFLFVLLIIGPHSCSGMPAWGGLYGMIGSRGGAILFCAGTLLGAVGVYNLGRNLTPLPYPKEHARLIVSGSYRIVRHPIYSGILFMAFGWAMWLNSWLTVGYALLLFAFFDIKSRYEERLLLAKFKEYSAYRLRVRKLIPFLC
jgi:protein-S-isoprenylcysteine O-methyltransferase Ste14